jgi:hypothetical protein
MTKTKPAAKSAKKLSIRSRTKTPNQVKRKKTKKSTLARYGARAAKRKAWAEKNPGMIPGDIGVQAHPAKLANSDDVAKVLAGEVVKIAVGDTITLSDSVEVKMEPKTGPREKLTAVDVTAQLGDRLDTSRDALTPADEGFNKPVEAKDVE